MFIHIEIARYNCMIKMYHQLLHKVDTITVQIYLSSLLERFMQEVMFTRKVIFLKNFNIVISYSFSTSPIFNQFSND